jgi:hypothetical protein
MRIPDLTLAIRSGKERAVRPGDVDLVEVLVSATAAARE